MTMFSKTTTMLMTVVSVAFAHGNGQTMMHLNPTKLMDLPDLDRPFSAGNTMISEAMSGSTVDDLVQLLSLWQHVAVDRVSPILQSVQSSVQSVCPFVP